MKKITSKSLLVALPIAITLYLLSRISNLTTIPVFADEAIYIRWSQIIKNVETLRFIPLTDGKQPLFMWLTVPFFKLSSDPLFAARLLSVFSGLGNLLAIYFTSNLLVNYHRQLSIKSLLLIILRQPSFLSVITLILYISTPFSFFFDRLATSDNLLSFWGILILFLTILTSKYLRLDLLLILGTILGLSWITKSPTIFFIALLLISELILLRQKRHIFFFIVPITIGYVIYNLLRLGPQFQQLSLRNLDYIHPLSEIIRHPLDPLKPHLIATAKLYLAYLSFPLIFISTTGFIISHRRIKNIISPSLLLVILSWWLLPLFVNCSIARVFTGRYILFTLPPLFIILSLGIYLFYLQARTYFSSRLPIIVVTILLLMTNLYYISRLSFFPYQSLIPTTERGYLVDWTSGWGIRQVANYLKQRSLHANVIVGTEGYFGTLPDGLQIYTDSLPQLTVFGVGLGYKQIPPKLIDARQHGDEVYLLGNKSRFTLLSDEYNHLDIISSFSKPDSDQLVLYRLK